MDIILANNSGLFAAWLLDKSGRLNDPVLLMNKFWIDNAINDKLMFWGQGTVALPNSFLIDHNVTSSSRMSFQDFKNIRKILIDDLHDNFRVFDIEDSLIEFELKKLIDEKDDRSYSLRQWVHVPKKVSELKAFALPYISSLFSKEDYDDSICVTSCGKSLESYLKYSHFLGQDDKSVIYLNVNSKTCQFDIREVGFFVENLEVVDNHVFYKLDNSNKCYVYNSSGIELLSFSDNYLNQIDNLWDGKDVLCAWVAPSNYPEGSIAHSLTILTQKEGLFFEEYTYFPAFYCADFLRSKFSDFAYKKGYSFNDKFFTVLDEKISNCSEDFVVELDNRLNIYLDAFLKSNNFSENFYKFKSLLLDNSPTKEIYHEFALNSAMKFVSKKLLDNAKEKNVNIITIESATGGSIVAELVKTPGYGRYIYGSFGVYDSDAKRHIGVMTPDVYTIEAAEEMALDALNHSRAMIGLSITGYTVPAVSPDRIGHLDIAIAVRGKGNNFAYSKHLDVCKLDTYVSSRCDNFIRNHKKVEVGDIAKLREYLIKLAVIESSYFAAEQLSAIDNDFEFAILPNKTYDGLYNKFLEPSPVISTYLAKDVFDEL